MMVMEVVTTSPVSGLKLLRLSVNLARFGKGDAFNAANAMTIPAPESRSSPDDIISKAVLVRTVRIWR